MRRSLKHTLIALLLASFAFAQDYTPKFPGDPARSNSEAAALGYMRVVVNAQKNYSKKHSGKYGTSLASLVNQGSFTKRMVDTHRGDYTARFKGDGKGYELWMTPNATPDATHRAFFVDERGTIRAEEDKAASAQSPSVNK